jgi:hypothetical protein
MCTESSAMDNPRSSVCPTMTPGRMPPPARQRNSLHGDRGRRIRHPRPPEFAHWRSAKLVSPDDQSAVCSENNYPHASSFLVFALLGRPGLVATPSAKHGGFWGTPEGKDGQI